MPTATAITAAIMSRTIGLRKMLPEESPPSEPPEEPTGTTCCSVWSFLLLAVSPERALSPSDVGEPVPPVGSVVVPVAPEVDDPLAEECPPDCGTFGRYSPPAGAARAGGTTASDNVAAAQSPAIFLRRVIGFSAGRRYMASWKGRLGTG